MSGVTLPGRRSRFAGVLALGTLALLIVGSGCTDLPPNQRGYFGEQQLLVYAAAQASSSGPYLSLEAGQTPAYTPASAGLDSGLRSSLGSVQGQAPAKYEFTLDKPLAKTYFLNLSKPVSGVVFWQSTLTKNVGNAASGYSADAQSRVLAELWSSGKRVGGGEVDYAVCSSAYSCSGAVWQRLVLQFRPEVDRLNQGDVLTLKIHRISGFADFTIGTGGAAQSFLELRYYDFDPLSGAVYLEDGKMFTFPDEEDTPASRRALTDRVDVLRAEGRLDDFAPGLVVLERPSDGNDGAALAVGVVLLPLAGILANAPLPSRRNSLAILVVLLLATLALSGCLGGGKGASLPTQVLNTDYVDDAVLREKGIGALTGKAIDQELQLPIRGGHVSILGTNLFRSTDAKGAFEFDNVSAASWKVRVDKDSFQSVEQTIKIEVGKRTIVTFELVRLGSVKERQHAHGEHWGAGDQVLVMEGTLNPKSAYQDTAALGSDRAYCVSNYPCDTSIRVPIDKIVPPGAGKVEVTLDWNPAGDAPDDSMLYVTTTANTTASEFVRRAPGDPYVVRFFPIEADPGHQEFSQWTFTVNFRPGANLYNALAQPPILLAGPVKVKIVAHKSVIPLEPAHRDFWDGKTELIVVKDLVGKATNCIGCDYPRDDLTYPENYAWVPGKKVFVPPGTKELRGTLRWDSYGAPANDLVRWTLSYKPANIPPAAWADGLKQAKEGTRGDHVMTFTIPVVPDETDQFYQSRSYWKFYPDDNNPPTAPGYGYGTTYAAKLYLEVVAVKDPSYE